MSSRTLLKLTQGVQLSSMADTHEKINVGGLKNGRYTQDICILIVLTNIQSRIHVPGVFPCKRSHLLSASGHPRERYWRNGWLIQQGMVMKAWEVNNFPKERKVLSLSHFLLRLKARHKESHWIPVNEHLCMFQYPSLFVVT